jgi:hypothetical protein
LALFGLKPSADLSEVIESVRFLVACNKVNLIMGEDPTRKGCARQLSGGHLTTGIMGSNSLNGTVPVLSRGCNSRRFHQKIKINMQKIEDLYVAFLQFIIGYTALIMVLTITKIGRNKSFIKRIKKINKNKNGNQKRNRNLPK